MKMSDGLLYKKLYLIRNVYPKKCLVPKE